MSRIPLPVLSRLSLAFDMITRLEEKGERKISSAELGRYLGQTGHTIRKDIHFLGNAGSAGAKYEIADLKKLIAVNLGFQHPKRCCIVGLGRLGSAILEYTSTSGQDAISVVAGFDSSVNRIETIQTNVELFPAYQLVEVARQKRIELAIITVPPENAQEVAERCCEGGVTGLLNFTDVIIKPPNENVFVRSVDITGEMRILAAQAFTSLTATE